MQNIFKISNAISMTVNVNTVHSMHFFK